MKRVIDWFVDNPVAANLLMLLIFAGGFMTVTSIKQALFPEITPPMITVSVLYPGAAPEEVEDAVCIKIEEAVHDLEGIKRVTSTSTENVGAVTIELETGMHPDDLMDEIKTRVDAIDTFPDEAEKPVIQKVEMKMHVVNVAVVGETDEITLKRLTEQIRDELNALPEINTVTLPNARPYEISIEVPEEAMRRHSLRFREVVDAVRRSSVELPGGSVKTEGGEILLRTAGKAKTGEEFSEIPLRTLADGTRLMLRDVAKIVDGFEDTDQWTRFNGKPALIVSVFRTGEQGVLEVAGAVETYLEGARQRLPAGIELIDYWDNSRIFRGRMELLTRNGGYGLILVFILLVMFFRLRLAIWVAVGLGIAFLGGIWTMPLLGVSINMLSLFAFIVVLGILVDDAIVVSENIYRHNQMGKPPVEAAKAGTVQVMLPVILAVGTTIAAFAPMMTIPGVMGDFASVIPRVVIVCLAFSLIESLLILPAHLRHLKTKESKTFWTKGQDKLAAGLQWFITRVYTPLLGFATRYRYGTLAFGFATLLVTAGLFVGGWMKFTFFPAIEADYVLANVTMPMGTPARVTDRVMARIESAAEQLRQEVEGGEQGRVFKHFAISIGTQPVKTQQAQNGGGPAAAFVGAHLGEAVIELVPAEERGEVSSADLVRRWRELVGQVPDALEVTYTADLMSSGAPINVQLSSPDIPAMRRAAAELKTKLREYSGIFDITDSYRAGKEELRLKIKPTAEALGLSEADLARQVRYGYYGAEAQRVQRGREDIKVMVRYPAEKRRSLADIENMRIRAANGVEIPFRTVADVSFGRGPAAIKRTDRQRSINVTADMDTQKGNADDVILDLEENYLPGLMSSYPGLTYSFEGDKREQMETMGGIFRGLIVALIIIYAMLAIPFRSYVQPMLIMFAIPFGVAGAIWAHFVFGMDMTLMSMIGIMALTGVVVNDSLIMIDFINQSRRSGMPAREAVLKSGPVRFRPILITSLTTFAGLTPMLLERSMQARFLIPMAVALAYGVLLATGVILLMVPATYLILEDARDLVRRFLGLKTEEAEDEEPLIVQ